MADIWQLIIHSNIVNFIIVLMMIKWLFSKVNLSEKLEKLKEEIKSYVDKSTEEKEDAEKSLEAIKQKIEHLPAEIEDIKVTAQNNIDGIAKRIEFEIEDKKRDIENNANRILNLEIKTFKEKLTSRISQVSVDLSRKNAIEQLSNNRELHNKYIYDAIDEIDRLSL